MIEVIFYNLLGTSAKKVEIFSICLNLAKETDPGMYGIIMMRVYPIHWRFHHF